VGVLPGPFKIVLQGLERSSSPDTLGDPTAARVRVEVGRLFQLDDETASNIVSAVPIVIVDGLDARAAGVVRDRMQVLRDAGCRVVITDEVTDTIPRVNWPQLPPIARVEPATDERRGGGGGHAEGLSCPHCGGGLQVVAAGSAPRGGPPSNGREPQREPEPAPLYNTSAPPTPAPREREREAARSARADDDDWLSPPVGASPPAVPPPPPSRRPSGRFDDAALLGYRAKSEPEPRRTPGAAAQAAPAASATATSDLLDVTFSDSSEVDPPLAPEPRRPPPPPPAEEPRSRGRPPAPAPKELEPSLLDSDDDERPRSKTATTTARRPGAPESKPADAGRSSTKSRVSDPFEDSLGGLDPAPVQTPKRGADPFSSQSSKRGADTSSSGRSSTASDPFEDSRLMEDLANDLGAGSSPDPLDDSGSDILDQLPPHRRKDAPEPKKSGGDARFESDLDLLDEGAPDLGGSDDDLPRAPAATPKRGSPAVSRAPTSSSHDFGDSDDPDDDGLSLLDSDELPPPPPPAAKKKDRPPEKGARGKGPDLDEVLNMFGPEDGAPLDDGEGLEPAPLDLSPPSRAAAKPARGGGGGGGRDRGFDAELSDILEPLDPGEALEIIKTSNPKPGRRPSAAGAASGMNGRHTEEPSGLEQLDDGEASAVVADEPRHDKRAAAKKSRGVPFPASDEDVGLFEDSSRGTRPQKNKKTDPFARARGRLAEEDEREKRTSGAERAGSDRAGSERSERPERGSGADRSGSERMGADRGRTESRPQKRGGGGAGAGGPPPSGDGEHGLVLSRIADPDKKEQAAEIIAEVKGCNLDEARRLTDRTIIPVLKGVSREVAEFHLEKFKRVKIAGRVTTRQRG
jgi:hypothetical protein